MMTVSAVYGPLGLSLFNGEVQYTGDAIKGMLLNSTYTPSQDTQRYVADIQSAEISGPGYTAGGLLLTGKLTMYDAPTNVVKLTCDNLQWANTTWTDVRYLVFYDSDTGALMSYVDFEVPQNTSGAPFTYLVPSSGILNMTIV